VRALSSVSGPAKEHAAYGIGFRQDTVTPGYDPDGNVTSDGPNSYLYDAEDRICAVASTNAALPGVTLTGYVYDASGTRISKGAIQVWSCDPTISGFSATNDYILGPGGEQLTEYALDTTNGTNAMAWQHTNVWAAGKLIGTYDLTEVHFYIDDQVGTRRVQTDYAGNVEKTCSSLPFGDGETCAATPTENLFTGKERDTESGNDYFGARYYASTMGRFLSPDWSAKVMPVPYATMGDPQSLNLYAYVRNNPLTGVDADGHCDKNGMLCQAWTWLTSNHSASASASATAAQGSASNGPLSATAKMGTAQASASASYGTNTSVSAKGSATLASTTINEGTHSTTQVDSHTVTADAHAGVSLGGDKGLSASAGAGAGAYVLSASQTETITLGPITITGSASGNVGVGANASASIGTSGVSASAGVTPGWGGSLSLSVGWNNMSVSGGGSAKGTMTTTTTSVDKPKVE